jgi:polyribonucleotide nucleotidyltransferase
VQVKVPNNKVGLIIGRGGETIKNLQSRCGVRIQVQNDGETEPGATERLVTLIGNKKATDMAYDLIKEVIDEVNLLAAYGQCGETHPCLHAHVCVGVLGCKLCFGCMQIHLWCL